MLAHPLAAVLALQTLAVPQAGPQYVERCDPCSIVLHDGARPADFRFKLETVPQGRVVKAIVFERGGHPVQKLNVPSMTPLAPNESFYFGGQEINFDGWLDLLLMTERGSTNAKAEYWLYDPAADRFRDLGEFPIFRVDAVHKRLSTYVSNGPAGLDFEKHDYAFEGNDLIVMSEETQKPSPSRPGRYVRTAPAVARPRGLSAEQVRNEIGAKLVAMDAILAQCEARFGRQVKLLDHPILGPLTATQWRKLHLVHGQHHLKQLFRLRESTTRQMG